MYNYAPQKICNYVKRNIFYSFIPACGIIIQYNLIKMTHSLVVEVNLKYIRKIKIQHITGMLCNLRSIRVRRGITLGVSSEILIIL